jgi:hypothetical protein
MRKQIYRVVAVLGVFFGLAVAGVQAQTPSKVKINIPFEFSAGKATLQPGVYSIVRTSGNLLTLRNSDGSSAVILDAPPMAGRVDEKAGERLVFAKSGDQYFLAEIWLSVDSGRRVFTTGKTDKAERVEISLRQK